MKYLFFFLFVLFWMPTYGQREDAKHQYKANDSTTNKDSHPTNRERKKMLSLDRFFPKPDSASLFPTAYGTFEKYAFVLNAKIITHQALVDYPNATLDRIFPYSIKLEGNKYQGAVYFHTPKHPAPPIPYADDPAYFINGKQVSPYDIRWSKPELYNRIEKSTQSTTIDGKRYKGTIHVNTDEDFFTERLPLPELLKKHTHLPLESIIVHWKAEWSDDSTSRIIQKHFPLYHIKPSGLRAVKIDRIQFAEGERYVVHLVDRGYRRGDLIDKQGIIHSGRWTSNKANLIFKDPMAINTSCPCYVAELDTTGRGVFHRTELDPEPYLGKTVYLKKLSASMGLPAKKPTAGMATDSITVRFIVTREGMLSHLESIGPEKRNQARILAAIKNNSCLWSRGMFSGRPVLIWRKMTIFYSKDRSGNIQSLDNMAYRYDDALVTHNSQLATQKAKSTDTAWLRGSRQQH